MFLRGRAGMTHSQDGSRFGELLRRLRIGAGLSQEELAGRSGLAERTIARLEQGRSQRPHPGSARRLAQALGLPDAERADLMACAAAAAAPPGRMRAAAQDRTEHGPRHLLPDTALFTGRDREIGALSALAEQVPGGASPGAVVISAIDGMGGVGKTALALHAAHRLAGRYPGRAPVHQPGRVHRGQAAAGPVPGAGRTAARPGHPAAADPGGPAGAGGVLPGPAARHPHSDRAGQRGQRGSGPAAAAGHRQQPGADHQPQAPDGAG